MYQIKPNGLLTRLRACAGVLGSLVLLSACGGTPEGTEQESFAGPDGQEPAGLTRVAIGTNPPGTSYYAVGGGIAKLIQEELEIPATVRPYAGSSVYLPLVQRGELALGLNTGIDSYFAYSASEVYASPMPNLRLLIMLWPIRHSYLVRADSEFETIEDLAGQRVVTDLSANAFLGPFHRAILATGGLTDNDVVAVNAAGLPEGLSLLTQGRVEATPAAIDLALVRQAGAAIPGGIRYLRLGQVDSDAPARVPGGSVGIAQPTVATTGFSEPMPMPRFHTFLNASVQMNVDDAYEITRVVYENWVQLQSDFPALAETPREALVLADVPIPYHDGSIRYYREQGLWTRGHEANQARVLGR
jgi:TRAP transporter TAXI family solute receptor